MRRFILSAMLAILACAAVALPTSAARLWCARDPLVRVGDTDVQIWVAIPQEFEPYVKDKVRVRIAAPKNLNRQVLYTDEGFNGHGERVEWADAKPLSDGSVPLNVEIHVIVDQSKIDHAFGKGTQVPVQAIVNIGGVTQTFEYATTKNTKFTLTLTDAVDDGA